MSPYVEKDPTKFYTYEEFEAGMEALREFCALRAESVRGQLRGTIPSTSAGQTEDSSALVDASHITLSDMGSMGGGGGFPGGNRDEPNFSRGDKGEQPAPPEGWELPEGAALPEMPGSEEGLARNEKTR